MSVEIRGETIIGEIEIGAPPETVFDALTNPVELASWWGSAETYRTYDWQVDLRPGGRYSCKAKSVGGNNGGNESEVHGEYTEVDPPRTLAFTWAPSWEQGNQTQVRYTLEPTASGTRLRIIHWGFGDRQKSVEGHAEGWMRVLGWLEQFCLKEIHS